jgi:catechol 2,3-dioxygenase-like lactoylglutathione lyase family enzyme
MIRVHRLSHVSFATPDLDKAISYYAEISGLIVAARERRRAFLVTKLGQLAVRLDLADAASCTGLAFEIAADAGFASVQRSLAGEGIKSELQTDTGPAISRSLLLHDPKGTRIELFSEPQFVVKTQEQIGIGPFKLGHVAFVVPEPKKIAEFYQRILGFRVSDWIEDFFVFLRCNSDHHAVNFVAGRDNQIHHFAFELQNFAHLQKTCDWLGERKIPLIWGPVRLGPGHNVAVFVRNADDQVVEFFAELDQMADETLGYFEPRPWHRDRPQWPKVWKRAESTIWGPPPTADFLRGRG